VSMRPLDRLPSIRAKLGVVIVFAVGMTVLLVFLLLGWALRNTSRDSDRLELLNAARAAAGSDRYRPPDGTTVAFLSAETSLEWGRLHPPVPVLLDGKVHQGLSGEVQYAAVPVIENGRFTGTEYALRDAPSNDILAGLEAAFGFLRGLWWRLLLAGALAAGIALFLARLLALGMTRPLRDMARATRNMSRGQYSQRVHAESRDEVGQLAAAFNRMSADLERTERMRRELVANVSHELKTPISALRAHLENLQDGVEQPDRHTMQVMLQQSERLSRLVEELLDLSRLEAGDVPMELREVDLRPLVDEVASEVRVASAGRDVGVANRLPSSLLPALADRERIHQVLYNLLDNAVRFTPAGGTVEVTGRPVPDGVEVTVRDTGPGIPAEHLPFVFERFYRVDQARARDDGGTGIGLAIARSIVDAHGGSIRATSDVEAGSSFTFDLPLAPVRSPEDSEKDDGSDRTATQVAAGRATAATGGDE